MKDLCKLTEETKRYLTEFYEILDCMIEGMTSAELTDSISYNFIVQMIPHHRAAIEMSKNILLYTQNKSLEGIACNIISTQTKSIENMQQIQRQCGRVCNSIEDLRLYQRRMDTIMHTMFCKMDQAHEGNNMDIDFMCEMIPHHQGAIQMAENTLKYEICSQLDPILCEIISSQKKGVREMKMLLQRMGCAKNV